MSTDSVDASEAEISKSSLKHVTINDEIRQTVVPKTTEGKIYDISHSSRGKAIVLNHTEYNVPSLKLGDRKGSDEDVKALNTVLPLLGVTVNVRDNLTVKGIQDEIKKVAAEDFSNTSCLMLFVLTHGGSEGLLYANDGSFSVQELYEPFLNNPTLYGKPKLFFLQACRGEFADAGLIIKKEEKAQPIDSVDAKASRDDEYTIPTYADMLFMYSTIEGVVSFRNENGSWLIQNLCQELKENLHEDLLSILTYVNNRVAYDKKSLTDDSKYSGKKQMPVVKHTLTKKFFFKSNGEMASTDVV